MMEATLVKITIAQIDLEQLTLAELPSKLFRALEKGRKKGTDLVVMPLLTKKDLYTEILAKKHPFLPGTCDYPDIFLITGLKINETLNLALISEGKVINNFLISNDLETPRVLGQIKDYEVMITNTSKKATKPQLCILLSKQGNKALDILITIPQFEQGSILSCSNYLVEIPKDIECVETYQIP